MIIHLEEFTTEAFDTFIESINKLESEEHLKIYISSNGGDITVKDCYVDIINSLQNVEVIGVICASAGFELLYEVNCEKKVLPNAYGCIHIPAWSTEIGNTGVPRGDFNKFKFKCMSEEEFNYKEILTEEEYKIYSAGNDLYLNAKRMRELCNIKEFAK